MRQNIYRLLFLLFIAAGTARMFAQTSDAAVWLLVPQLDGTTFAEGTDEVVFDFDEGLGYGISFNHFWTGAFSTEFALQKYDADLTVELNDASALKAGQVDITSFTAMAQFHFIRAGRFSPYVGAGGAYLSGELDPVDDIGDPGEIIDLESELTWTAAVGVNFAITQRISIGSEIKYIPWTANAEDGAAEDAIDVNPVTFAAGVRFRF